MKNITFIKKKILATKPISVNFTTAHYIFPVLIGLFAKATSPLDTQHISDFDIIDPQQKTNVYAIKELKYVNYFIINTPDGSFAIDVGYWGKNKITDLPIISSWFSKYGALKKLGLKPEDVRDVFLTHSDPDHMGGISFFQNARFYMSQAEDQLVRSKSVIRFNEASSELKRKAKNPHFDGYKMLQNEEEIHIGDISITSILTEGHTKGSMSFLVTDSKERSHFYLFFVGDTIFLKPNGPIDTNFSKKNEIDQSYFRLTQSWRLIYSRSKSIMAQNKNNKVAIVTAHSGWNFATTVFDDKFINSLDN
jgi:glyoxylase-like metal-dependent hydrolase (beta-lactamase superfamily II)